MEAMMPISVGATHASPTQTPFEGSVRARPASPLQSLLGPFVAFLCALGALCGSAAFAACPGDPKFVRSSVFKVTTPTVTTRYFHDRTTAQIQAMWRSKSHGSGRHNPGLTVFEHQVGSGFQVVGEPLRGGKGFCLWAEKVEIDFAIKKMDVYVSRQYAFGSCQHKAILDHENTHVTINRRVHQKYRMRLQEALRADKTLPLEGNPIQTASVAEGQKIVSRRLEALVQPIVRAMEAELRAENAKIDTPDSYRKLSARCGSW
jgi:hypothetical protein